MNAIRTVLLSALLVLSFGLMAPDCDCPGQNGEPQQRLEAPPGG